MSRPLRVLHVDKFASRSGGGATGFMLELVQHQRAHGHTVEYLATAGATDVETSLVAHFPPRPEFDPPPEQLRDRVTTAAHMVWSRAAARAMERVLALFQPDVVHAHNLYHQLTPSVLRPVRRAGVPVVMTIHDFKLVCPTYRMIDGSGQACDACVGGSPLRVAHVVRRRCQGGSAAQSTVLMVESGLHRLIGAYDPVDVFACPSSYMADLLRRGGFGDRVRELPYGYDLDSIPPRTEPGTGVVFAGRLSWEKGLDHLLHAMALLPEVPLVVCGDGPQRQEWHQLADRLLPGRVTFLGHLPRSAVLAELRRAAVVAVPSIWAENQPLSIVEAMASGVPVVAGDTPALREMVIEGTTGLTVDPRDHLALSRALSTFLDNPALQRDIAVTARRRAETVHDMQVHLERLDDIYDELCGRASPRTRRAH